MNYLRLLSIELQKLRYNRAAKTITIIYFGLFFSIALISTIQIDWGGMNFKVAEQGIFNFPFIWHFNTYLAAILKLFLAVVIVSMISNEYSYGTLKQNLIDGLSKKEFIMSKVVTVGLFSTLSTVFIFILSLVLGLVYSENTAFDVIFKDLQYVFAYFLKLFAFFSMCLFLGVLVRRSAFALGFLGIWQIGEWILMRFFSSAQLPKTAGDFLINLLPLNAMSSLIKEPFTRLNAIQTAASDLGQPIIKSYNVGMDTVTIVLAWTLFFIYASYKVLDLRDL